METTAQAPGRLPFRVLAAVAVSAPATAALGPQNPPAVLALAAAAIALFRRDAIWRFVRDHATAVAAIDLFLVFGFISRLWTIDVQRSLGVAASNLAIVTCGLVVCAGVRDLGEEHARKIVTLAGWHSSARQPS